MEVEAEIPKEYEEDEYGIVWQCETVKYNQVYDLNDLESCDLVTIIKIMSSLMEGIIKQTDAVPDKIVTVFHSKSVPCVPIGDYILRIVKYGQCSIESVILALIYIDRLIQMNPAFILKSLNVHR